MPHRKIRDDKEGSSHRETVAKADKRFAKADAQRTRVHADPEGEVVRAKSRVKKETPGA
jgi:hypothetical protein